MGDTLNATKSENLLFIRDYITKSFVEDIIVFTVEDFLYDRIAIIDMINDEFKGDVIIVRSSYRNNHGNVYSKKGNYKSVIGVRSGSQDEVDKAVMEVISSYVRGDSDEEKLKAVKNEQILVQRQATDIAMIGNVYTRDVLYNRPYYVINYSEKVSVGENLGDNAGNLKWIAKNVSREFLDEKFYRLIEAVKEIEQIYDEAEVLEIEFAIDFMGNIIIFQLRQLYKQEDRPRALTDHEFYDTKSFAKCTYLDEYHVLSDMACLGLTENLGTNPRPLDYSLYRELITNNIWGEAVSSLGYYKVDEDIMQKIGNKPYVSVNMLFDGLTPAAIDDKLRYKLKEYYVEKLLNNRSAHSRIETEIAFSSYDFSLDEKLWELREYGFNEQEISTIRMAIFEVTRDVIMNYSEICGDDSQHIDELIKIRHDIRAHSPLQENNSMKLYGYIGILMEAVRQHGTAQFIRQSRCSLMAVRFCNSLVEKGYFTRAEIDKFLNSIQTMTTKFEEDFDLYSQGMMPLKEFDKLYGHMRMGAFDIRTESYRAMYGELTDNDYLKASISECRTAYTLDENKLKKALYSVGLNIEPERFADFLRGTIINREKLRFESIKSFCLILEMIARLGKTMGIAREDMSYLEINDLLSYHSRETYIQDITSRRDMYHANIYLMLPEVIFGVGDIDVINQKEVEAVYITDKIVEADIVDLKDNEMSDISGKIVTLSSVNSAYNWIFTRRIAGFIAKYGKADSFMAKRCEKLGIPAMIGCGERIYGKVVKMGRLRLDCANKKIVEL